MLFVGNTKYKLYVGNSARLIALDPLIPAEYRQVQYIQGTGVAYVNTGIKGATGDIIKVKYNTIAATTTDWHYIVGYMYSESDRFGIYHQAAGKLTVDFWKGSGSTNRKANILDSSLNTVYNYEVGNCYVKDRVDGQNLYSESSLANYSSSRTYQILDSRSGKAGARTTRIYECVIIKNNAVVLEYIPVQRISDGVFGFYDLISKQFKGSSSSTNFTGA